MTKSKPFRVGIDTGGTFTDLVMMDETTGRIELVKMSSTPVDPSIAFMEVLNRCLKEQDLAADDCLHLVHGTTVATNTIIEGKGAKNGTANHQRFSRCAGNRPANSAAIVRSVL